MQRFLRFAVAGGLGFLADGAVLALCLRLTPLGPLQARLVSIAIAVLVTWRVNRAYTFGPSGRGVAHEGLRYGGVSVASSLFNYGVYSAALYLAPTLPPLAALAIASAAALAVSFLGYGRLVFDR